MVYPAERFGMSDEEKAARFKLRGQALDKGLMCGTVEVKHHVAAEDGGIAGDREWVHQVEACEIDEGADVRENLEAIGFIGLGETEAA